MINESQILSETCHGKACIRVAKVTRNSNGRHDVLELSVSFQLFGGTDESFRSGDNNGVVATDTCRNHVYLHAKASEFQNCEQFSLGLAVRMLTAYDHVERVKVTVEEKPWERAVLDGMPHNHGFVNNSYGVHKCNVDATRGSICLFSALQNLGVLKTTQSGWSNFMRDRFTTLQETNERLLATTICAKWVYQSHDIDDLQRVDFSHIRGNIRRLLLATLFGPTDVGIFSPGVQNTLYNMASSVIQAIPCLASITLSLPNLHFLPCEIPVMKQNGFCFEHDIYIPTDEPHGTISATICRPLSKL